MPQNRFLAACYYECTNLHTGYVACDCELEAAKEYALAQAHKGDELSTWLVSPLGQRYFIVDQFCATLH